MLGGTGWMVVVLWGWKCGGGVGCVVGWRYGGVVFSVVGATGVFYVCLVGGGVREVYTRGLRGMFEIVGCGW